MYLQREDKDSFSKEVIFEMGLKELSKSGSYKGLSRVFSNTTVQKHQFIGAQLSL